MSKEVSTSQEVWAAFEGLFLRFENQGGDKLVKGVLAHIEKYSWNSWWPTQNRQVVSDQILEVYANWMAVRFSERRYEQLISGNYKFWIYFHGNAMDPRASHSAWDGIVLSPEHPFWDQHFPPCGWGCTCYVSGATSENSARRLGGNPDKALPANWNAPRPKTGRPIGIDWQIDGQRWPTLIQILEAVLGERAR